MLTGRNLTVLGMTESRPSEGYIVGYRLTAAGWCETSRREATPTLARVSALTSALQSPRAWEWVGGQPRRVLAGRGKDSAAQWASDYPSDNKSDLLDAPSHSGAQQLSLIHI